MKKLFVFLLVLIMILSLTACGESKTIATMADIYKAGYRATEMALSDNVYAAAVAKDGDKYEYIVVCELSDSQFDKIEPLYEQGLDSEKELVNVIAQNSFAQFVSVDAIGAETVDKAFLESYIKQFQNEDKGIPVGQECETLDELNESVGASILSFGIVGISGESFDVLDDSVALYQFKYAGIDFAVMATRDLSTDVTGFSAYDEPIVNEYGVASIKSFENEDVKSIGFVYDNVQYAFIAYDEGALSYDDFSELADDYRELVYEQSFNSRLLELEGTEESENDDSIMMLGLPIDPETIQISIYLYAKDGGTKAYAMHCRLIDGRLVYDSMVITEFIDYQLQNSVTDGGYFDYDGETLTWTGAPDDELAKIVFDL